MNTVNTLSATVLAATLLTPSALPAEQVSLDDFAWHLPIETGDDGPLHELLLPLAVYREATDARLGDLRVFNAAGNAVPHGLLPSALDNRPRPPHVQPVPLFPFAEALKQRDGDLDVRITRDGERTSVTVRSGGQPVTVGSWLVDTARLPSRPRALLLGWPDGSAPMTRRVRVQGSHDLSRWYGLGRPVTVADVRWAGERLLANRLELSGARYRWYRIETEDGDGPLPLTTVRAELASAGSSPTRREWMQVQVAPAKDSSGELVFETPTALPVERLRISPADRNTFLRLQVETLGADDEWHGAGAGNAYRLDFENGSLEGPPITVQTRPSGRWRLRALDGDTPGTGFGRTPPGVEVGWTPRSLVFLARGEGPYVLAFGSRRVTPVHGDGRQLLGDSVRIVDLPRASAGALLPGPAPEKAMKTAVNIDWKQVLLWCVLVVGVILLAALAYRLIPRTNTTGGAG